MIQVTIPFLPPKDEYLNYVNKIWDTNWLTNNGPLLKELEVKLQSYLQSNNMLFLGNGTIAIQIAIKALELKGEVITTPFSYVATTSSLVWENCKPVFIDINESTFNINEELIESAITAETSAILTTHVFGNPCNVEQIEKIAAKHNLKVIYDAAHCFSVKYKNQSIFNFGDVSTTSFHATKLFHTIEGGAVFTNSDELNEKMSFLRNFGHNGPEKFALAGVNGKNSEFHAAMGLCNLKHIEAIKQKRKAQYSFYKQTLVDGNFAFQKITENTEYNYSYFPVVFESEEKLLHYKKILNKNNIYPRRYFYPSLNTLSFVESAAQPVSENIAKKILCLPLYHTLTLENQKSICKILLS